MRLEAGINEYKRIAQELEERSAALNRELSEARKTIAELSAYQSVPLVPPQPVSHVLKNPANVQSLQQADMQDFAAVLQNSLERKD